MAHPALPPHADRTLGFERFVFFSDAVFAIAITLLVLDLKPARGPDGAFLLAPAIPSAIGFAISFYVVGRYWIAHHQLFETVRAHDGPLLTTNLCFLAAICFLPFPTSVVAQFKPDSGPVMFYALSVAAVGALMIALILVARRESLLSPGETKGGTARMVFRATGAPLVFIAAACVAYDYPRIALWLILALIPVNGVLDRVGAHLSRRIDAPPPPSPPAPRP